MIAFVRGTLVAKSTDSALVEVSGIGYSLALSARSVSRLPALGEEVCLHTYLQVREDFLGLYGFIDAEEKALFEKLMAVSGVGAKIALAALSSYNPNDLVAHIRAEDVQAVCRIPGIGKKTAQRIILELKEKLGDGGLDLDPSSTPASREALGLTSRALASMGFVEAEISAALEGVSPGASESEALQYALRNMSV